MDRFEVEIGFSSEVMEEFEEKIIESLNIDDKISDWIDSNFDIEYHLQGVNLNDGVDVDGRIQDLLDSYNPNNGCETGIAFSNAIEKYLNYSFGNNYSPTYTLFSEMFKKFLDESSISQNNNSVESLKDLVDQLINQRMADFVKKTIKEVIAEGFGLSSNNIVQTQNSNPAEIYTSAPVWNYNK
jgi:hypothetical protein